MSILCTIKNLNLSFGLKLIFENASFNISSGDRIGLLGLNGQGKSSLFKILEGVVTPDISTPPFQFDKATDVQGVDKMFTSFLIPQELKIEMDDNILIEDFVYRFYPELKTIDEELNTIQTKFESPDFDFEKEEKTIDRQSDLLEKFEHLGGNELLRKYESYLKSFGLSNHSQKMNSLSGGEQKKVLLALGLSATANLILWDEPTNHLDLETIKVFETELSNSSKTFVIISHDRFLLGSVTDKIFHIRKGQIESFKGSYPQYLEFLTAEEEVRKVQLKRLKNTLKREQAWMRQGVKARATRSKKRVEGFHNIKDDLQKLVDGEKKKLSLNVAQSTRKTKTLAKIENLSVGFNADNILIKNLTLNLNLGDKIGLMGGNGVGKTSLLKTIMGLIPPLKGMVKSPEDIKIQYFSQDRKELKLDLSAFEILGDGSDFVTHPDGRKQHVAAYFESFLFRREDLHRPLSSFSGGEKNRLQMALNLLKAADLWIFDEPTNDLDLETLEILEDKLQQFKGTLLLISHDRAFLSNITNKIWLINNKEIEYFDGGYEHAADYLDALIYRDIILKEEAQNMDKSLGNTPNDLENKTEGLVNKPKLTNSQKAQNKKEIDQLETMINTLEKAIAAIDLDDLNDQSCLELGKFNDKKDELEEKLLQLYEHLDA